MLHEFVEYVPANLEDGVIYISITYGTAIHKCCCGCGNKVVTPFSPTDWKLIFDGESISLHPSIGNWSFECKSHYWIRNNKVEWTNQWSTEEINAGRHKDQLVKAKYYKNKKTIIDGSNKEIEAKKSFWQTFKRWLFERSGKA